MKTKIFNSAFEIALRIVILMHTFDSPQTVDALYAADFISTYGADFGASPENLNGDNHYKFCELSTRRDLVQSALNDLVLAGMAIPGKGENGFVYSITNKGKMYSASFESEYATEYRVIAKTVTKYVLEKSERAAIIYINHLASKSLKKGARV